LLAAPVACGRSDNALIQNRGASKDNWWDALPRPAWSEFEKVAESQGWFEVYRIRPGLFAIYEPGQFEEVISYLAVGEEKALLFDSGLGIGDMKAVVSELTELAPIVVNSHTHYDHVGGNHQFSNVYGAPTEYTRTSAKGRKHEDVAEFVGEGWIWKKTPPGFDGDEYESKPFEIRKTLEDGRSSIRGVSSRSCSPRATPPTRSVSSIGRTACYSPATRSIPLLSTRIFPARTSRPTGGRRRDSPGFATRSTSFSPRTTSPSSRAKSSFACATHSRLLLRRRPRSS
jgi:hypothetical protein